jgi:hypothetical protein
MRNAQLENAVTAVRHRTLSKTSGLLERLRRLSSLRHDLSGRYFDPQLAPDFSREVINSAIARCHRELFRELLERSLESFMGEVERFLRASEISLSIAARNLRTNRAYLRLVPTEGDSFFVAFFESNMKAALTELESRFHGASDNRSAEGAPGLQPESWQARLPEMSSNISNECPSCFISYSRMDEEFTKNLHGDLRSEGVQCWFDWEDLKIGDEIRPSIDDAIRRCDKLLIVLSKNSVGSPWVRKEVETAFGKEMKFETEQLKRPESEREPRRTVLFPIRLDDAVMETDEAWAADLRRMRHIGDFRGWKEHDKYKAAFERLMRNLKA